MNTQQSIRLAFVIGSWLVCKLRRQQRTHGTFAAALNAKKQGLPLNLALAALAGRRIA